MTEKLILDGLTPEEAHVKYGFGPNAKCAGCGRRPLTRIITLAPLKEAMKRYPSVALLAQTNEQLLLEQLVPIRENPTDKRPTPYVRLGVAFACKTCTPAAEREAAKAPSWCIVEINRGPGTKTQAQVPRS